MLRSVVATLGFVTILVVLIIVGVLAANSLGGTANQVDAAKHAKKQAEDVQHKLNKDLKKGQDY